MRRKAKKKETKQGWAIWTQNEKDCSHKTCRTHVDCLVASRANSSELLGACVALGVPLSFAVDETELEKMRLFGELRVQQTIVARGE